VAALGGLCGTAYVAFHLIVAPDWFAAMFYGLLLLIFWRRVPPRRTGAPMQYRQRDWRWLRES